MTSNGAGNPRKKQRMRVRPKAGNGDERVRFDEVRKVHPYATIQVEQVEPTKDQNIPPRPINVLEDYDGLIRYIRDTHWASHGAKRATYQWYAKASGHPRIANGRVYFEECEDSMSRQQPPGGYGHPGFPPYAGYPHFPPPGHGYNPYYPTPGYGMPQQYAMPMEPAQLPPAQGQPQQQGQPQPQPQPQYAPQPQDAPQPQN